MKKIVKFTLVLLAGVSVAHSCSKTDATSNLDKNGTPIDAKQITINATISDALTRVEYTYDDSGTQPKLTLKWENSDILVVSNASGFVELTDPTIDETGKTAIFSGTLPEGGEPYTVSVKHAGSNLGTEQTQVCDGDLKHLEYAAMATEVMEADLENLTLSQTTGVLGLIAKLPTDVSAVVKAVIFQTEKALFNGDNTLMVNLQTSGAGTDNILHVYANVAAANIPAGTEMFIRFKVGDGANDYYTRYQVFASDVSLNTGALNGLKLNCSHIDRYAGKDDKGTDAAPYLIADGHQLASVNGLAEGGSTTFFKLIDDVDMTGITHNHINTNSGYTQAVDFDGNNKTISYLGKDLFYVIKGSVYDLTLDHSNVTARGILAEYVQGTGHKIMNVNVKRGKVNSSSNNVGALVGMINNGSGTCVTIGNCKISDTEVKGAGMVGGLAGKVDAACEISGVTVEACAIMSTDSHLGGLVGEVSGAVVFDDCHVITGESGSAVTFGGQVDNVYVGGAFGYFHNSEAKVGMAQPCSVVASVTAYNYAGGFIGYLDGGTIANNTADGALQAHSSIGGFVGYCNAGTLTTNSTSVKLQNGSLERNKPYTNVGGFVGNSNGGSFENNSAEGDVIASQNTAGGFVGYAKGSYFSGNSATGKVTALNNTGGFVGYCLGSSSFEDCFAEGVVSGQQGVGGFAGRATDIAFTNCSYRGTSVTGTQSSSNAMLGGFCGYTETSACTFTSCFVFNESGTTVIGATQRVGGFIGQLALAGDSVSKCYVKDVSVKGSGNNYGAFCGVQYGPIQKSWVDGGNVIAGGTNVGGFSGYQEKAALADCFSTATVDGGNFANIGGITGQLRNQTTSTITNCYYAGNLSGTGVKGGIVGLAAGTNCVVTASISWDSTLPVCGSSGTITNCYVKNEEDTSISSIAQTLGWSSDVWDFTGELPTLK